MPEKGTEQKTENPTVISNTDCPIDVGVLKNVINGVPEKVTFGLKSPSVQKSKDAIVDKDNDKAQLAIIKAYTDHELERVKRQKWLLWAVVLLTAGQLIFFNYVIYLTLTQSFQTAQLETISNLDVINNLFEILKYYIGATVVELIGMVLFITKGTFSSDHVKTMELMLNGKSAQESEASE